MTSLYIDNIIRNYFNNVKTKNCATSLFKRRLNKLPLLSYYINNRFLDSNSWTETIWRIRNNVLKKPCCIECGKQLKFPFKTFCSCKCRSNNKLVKQKQKETCKINYGVDYPSQNNKIKEKIKDKLNYDEITIKTKETKLKKYGDPHYNNKEKIKKTCLEKYGVENAFQSTEVKDKIKSTNLKRYGVENPIQSKEIQDKIKQTCLEKYGVEHPMLTIEVKNKIKQTCLEKYGVEHHSKCASVFQHYKNTCLEKYGFDNYELYYAWENIKNLKNIVPLFSKNDFKGISQIYKWKCSLCGNEFYSKYTSGNLKRKCDCQKISGISKSELELFDFCKQHFTNIIQHNRQLIKPFELDIVIPELHLAIEFNGIFWHSITIRNTFKLSSNEN